MSKAQWKHGITNWTERCVVCRGKVMGPGDRCPDCQRKLRERKRRKPR